jgi:hypothetical protein
VLHKNEVIILEIMLQRILSLIPKKPDGKYVHGAKKEFCEKIGAPTNIVSEWEKGKTKSYRNYTYVIAAEYNVSVEWLTGESDVKEKTAAGSGDSLSDQESYFIHCLRLMTEEERKCFMAQAKGVTKDRDVFSDNKEQ